MLPGALDNLRELYVPLPCIDVVIAKQPHRLLKEHKGWLRKHLEIYNIFKNGE